MSKMRVYELAKELGVENKVILDRAAALGFAKASHSSTVDDDEATQIRRAILRQSVSGPARDSETLTQRVDRTTGETEAIVERRKGNVIRRRRAASDEVVVTPSASSTSSTSEISVGGNDSGAAFGSAALETAGVAAEVVSPPELSVVPPTVDEVPVETAPVAKESGGNTTVMPTPPSVAVVEPRVMVPQRPAMDAAAARALQTSAAGVAPAEDKKGAGPKILGRIELPEKRAPRPEVRRPEGGGVAATGVAPSAEEDERNKARRSRMKKREVTRVDLVNYEGRDGRVRVKAGRGRGRGGEAPATEPQRPQKRVVNIGDSIVVGELAKQMSVKVGEVIAKLIELGMMATINQVIDKDTATIVAEEFGAEVVSTSFDEKKITEENIEDDADKLTARPPVVTIMGHVDHGKTTLLDTIRSASVAAGEAGGITQHIGAYQVEVGGGKLITFLDTPGHAAFTAMRARGASVTDMVVLVVSADDGVMPQTVEAINHAKAAGVPILVAVNKIDKPGANPERIRQQLLEHGLQPEDWGGDTMFFNVSALKKTGIKELLEGILLVGEVEELRANPDRRARGTIIESRQEKGLGAVATVLVQNGTLHVGDIFVCGGEWGKVRSMMDYRGQRIKEAPPAMPVEISGLSGVPSAGDDFFVVENEAKAQEVASNRAAKAAAKDRTLASGPMSLEEFARRANEMGVKELNVVIKADVHGSVDAVRTAVENLSTPKVKVRVLHAAVGGVSESDIQLSLASRAIVIGFNVRGEVRALESAEQAGIEVRFYRIIYELIDDVKQAMAGLLPPIREEVRLGRVEVRNTFVIPKFGTIAGSFVVDGMVKRGALVRLLRDSKVIFEGKMSSLRRFKDDAREVQAGYECGIGLESYNDVKVGDVLEVYEMKETAATLE